MRYKPHEPPFWEKEAGDGPLTRWQRHRERIDGLMEITREIEYLEGQRHLVNGNGRYLQCLYAARKGFLESMGRTRYIELGDFKPTVYDDRGPTRRNGYEHMAERTELPYEIDWGEPHSVVRVDGSLGDGNRHIGHGLSRRRTK